MKAEILAPTPENIARASRALLAGETVAIPTETVYGLAAVATDASAVAKIFAAKDRPTFDPLIAHVAEAPLLKIDPIAFLDQIKTIDQAQLSETQKTWVTKLLRAFWPGPLTLVLPKSDAIPDLATSGLSTVGLRCPRHAIAQSLLQLVGKPLAAPSANRFGKISPTSAEDVFQELGDRIPIILDGGRCAIGLESTILGFAPEPVLYRPGGIPIADLEMVLERAISHASPHQAKACEPQAPGQLLSHYAPTKPLSLLKKQVWNFSHSEWREFAAAHSQDPQQIRILVFSKASSERARQAGIETFEASASNDFAEGAKKLFEGLRALDESPAEMIFAEPPIADWSNHELNALKGIGLAHAIGDRLLRASH